jgi:restriction system protein
MSLWLVRAGKYGEHELKFIDDKRVYLTWDKITANDMTGIQNHLGIKKLLLDTYLGESVHKLGNWSAQISAFLLAMKVGDWVVMPRKNKPTIAIGEIKSECKFDTIASDDKYRHYREIKWLNTEIPRSTFDQDLLYSFGAFLTVCEISRNDAEKRVRNMANNSWHSTQPIPIVDPCNTEIIAEEIAVDLGQLARDSIAKLIIQKFKGHGMARLVDAVFKAQGFTTFLSPEGPDKGIDILAAGGAFGFNTPKICVQVKSGDSPASHPEFTQLIGAMQSAHADHGLFVSWSDFKPTVYKEVPVQFFKVRLWNQKDLIDQLLENYDKLDQDIRAELPLKRIWTVATPEE